MKLKNLKTSAALVLAACSLLLAPCSSKAQTFDPYGQLTTTILLANTNITASGSNLVFDTHGYQGNLVFLVAWTNVAGTTPTLTLSMAGSNDKTNWTAVNTASVATKATNSYTNYLLATAVSVTQTNFVPSTSFSTTTVLSAATAANFDVVQYAVPVNALPGRFLDLVWTIGGSASPSYNVSMFMIGRNGIAQ